MQIHPLRILVAFCGALWCFVCPGASASLSPAEAFVKKPLPGSEIIRLRPLRKPIHRRRIARLGQKPPPTSTPDSAIFATATLPPSALSLPLGKPAGLVIPALLPARPNPPQKVAPQRPDWKRRPKVCVAPPYNPAKGPHNRGAYVQLDDLDKAMFRQLRRVYYTSRHCHHRIWGGKYMIHRIPTYLVNIGSHDPSAQKGIRGFLFNPPLPPPGATLISTRQTQGIPHVYLYQAKIHQIPDPGFTFDLAFPGFTAYGMIYGRNKYHPMKNYFLHLFIHEAFHRVQNIEESWRSAKGHQNNGKYAFDAESIALVLLENRVLAAGYHGAHPQVTLQMLFAIRSHRIRRNPSGQRLEDEYDNLQEHLEGTAQYAEDAFLRAFGEPFKNDDINSIPQRLLLLENYGLDADAAFVRASAFSRFYGSGSTIAILLDRLKDATWKESCRKGLTFYQILQRRFAHLTRAQLKKLLAQAQQRFQIARLRKLARALAQKFTPHKTLSRNE